MTSRGASQTEPFDPAVVAFCERLADRACENRQFQFNLVDALGADIRGLDDISPYWRDRLIQLLLSVAPSDRSDA